MASEEKLTLEGEGANVAGDAAKRKSPYADRPEGMSKNAYKRLKKQEKFEEERESRKAYFKAKDKARAERKKQRLKEERAANPETEPKQRRKFNRFFNPVKGEAPRCVIDCDFDDLMNDKEAISMAQQLVYTYSLNVRAAKPFWLYFTGFGKRVEQNYKKMEEYDKRKGIELESRSYLDIFKKDELVYLTADSPTVIDRLDTSKVYIIGGIVDRNRHKYLTYNKAKEQGIATARLPLEEYLKLDHGSKVLTVNHVFEILTKIIVDPENWQKALLDILPGRKGVHARDAAEETASSPSKGASDNEDQ